MAFDTDSLFMLPLISRSRLKAKLDSSTLYTYLEQPYLYR